MTPKPIKPKRGQESVWDYPRPPKLEKTNKSIEVYLNGTRIVRSNDAYRVLETSHPPNYYVPLGDVDHDCLIPSEQQTHCEWKGPGSYYHLKVGDQIVENAAWYYAEPTERFAPIKNHLAFYADKMDKCLVDGEEVTPQPGRFYGGWITDDVVGPFKGIEGSWGW